MLGDSLRRRRPERHPPGFDEPEEPEAEGTPGLFSSRAQRHVPRRRTKRRPGPGPRGRFWLLWTGAAVLVLAVSFGVGYLLASQFLFPRPETAGTGIPVPNLYGVPVEEAVRALENIGLEVGPVTEMASQRMDPGRVLAQEPVPDQQLRPGAMVALAVSAGPPEVRVPPLTGLGATTARALLEAAGFDVEVQQVRTGVVPANAVVRTEPEAGSLVALPTAVTMVVSAGAPEPDPPEPDDTPNQAPWP